MSTENQAPAAPAASAKAQKKPEAPNNQRRNGPLSEQELEEIMNTAKRVPGLGRIILSLVRNRNARVTVPETAMGGEMLTIVSELDRIAARGERVLARALTLENLQVKNKFQEQALALITPLAQLTAEMALNFDHPTNPIVRHSRTKAMLVELRKKGSPSKTDAPQQEAVE
jgi:hypothetical protein